MKQSGTWSSEEHKLYLEAKKQFKSWAQVSQHVRTRSPGQCRSHDQKMRHKFSRENLKCPSATESKLKKDAATQWEPRSISYYAKLTSHFKLITCTTQSSNDFTDISSTESSYSRYEYDFSSNSVSNSAYESLADSVCIEEFESHSFQQ